MRLEYITNFYLAIPPPPPTGLITAADNRKFLSIYDDYSRPLSRELGRDAAGDYSRRATYDALPYFPETSTWADARAKALICARRSISARHIGVMSRRSVSARGMMSSCRASTA